MDAVIKDLETRMQVAADLLSREFAGVRTGRASTGLLDAVRVEAYGTLQPISQVATVSVPDARSLVIQPWDVSQIAAIEKAIQKSDLGLTPSNDGKLIRLVMPTLTEERRKQLAKAVGKFAEDARVVDPQYPPGCQRPSQGARQEQARIAGRRAARPRSDPEGHRPVHRQGRRAREEEGAGNPRHLSGAGATPAASGLIFLERLGSAHVRYQVMAFKRGSASTVAELSALAEEDLREHIRSQAVPRHVAVIMDGNGRWATQRGFPRVAGHREGVTAVRNIVRAAGELGIEFLTLYAFSSENWNRPSHEVATLMSLLERSIDRELPELMARNVRFRVIGRPNGVPSSVSQRIEHVVAATTANTGLTLLMAFNYGGRDELVDAFRTLAGQVQSGALRPEDIDEVRVSRALYTDGVPDPDLLIRTSGEMRVSNFLLWQIAYTELWMTPTLWPDFGRA